MFTACLTIASSQKKNPIKQHIEVELIETWLSMRIDSGVQYDLVLIISTFIMCWNCNVLFEQLASRKWLLKKTLYGNMVLGESVLTVMPLMKPKRGPKALEI